MHYGLIAIGSRGDVQPFVALALGLKQKGHEVTIIAHENFQEFVENYGLRFRPVFGNAEEFLHSEEGKKILNSESSIAMVRYIEKAAKKNQNKIDHDILKACHDVDILVSSALAVVSVYSIAEKTNKKWIIVQLSFPVTPTKEFPFAGMSYFNFPFYNLFTYWTLLTVYWLSAKKEFNRFRTQLGLYVLKQPVTKKITAQGILTLYCVSPSLIDRPKDWPRQIMVTGNLVIPITIAGAVRNDYKDDDLALWLSQGSKPIYVGFGSMPIPNAEKFMGLLLNMAEKRTDRFVFCSGWSRLTDIPNVENIYQVTQVNHEWLLPQCKAAVIHGGAGTVAACFRSGIPVVILSIFGDQPWWGNLIQQKRLGVHIPFKKITLENLSLAIDAVLSLQMMNNAEVFKHKFESENGVNLAIETIENYIAENTNGKGF